MGESRVDEITDEIFQSAIAIVKNMPKEGEISISNGEKLRFYALFKQATIGQCKSSRPPIWSPIERFKWDSWSSLGNLDPKKAREEYVVKLREAMDKVFEKYDVNEMMQNKQWSEIRTIVEPHFEKIGRPLTKNDELQRKTEAFSTDEEYIDAPDSPVIIEESKFAPNDPLTTNGLKTELLSYVQSTTKSILHQIQILSNTLQKQNAVIHKFIDFMKKKQQLGPISWPFLILLFIWPVIVQLAIRYIFRQH